MKPDNQWVDEWFMHAEQAVRAIQADALETAASLGERNDPTWVRLGWAAAIRALKPKEVGK